MKKKRLSFTLAIFSVFWASFSSDAQNTNYIAPDAKMVSGSSTAASLNGITSPSLFDGSANINIPIFNYSYNNTGYGVSLSYNTKGVPIDEAETPAGLHWQINAGPSVVRIVHDLPDEMNVRADSLLNSGDTVIVNKERYLRGKIRTYMETQFQQTAPNVYRDGACDEFIASLNGTSFKFYIGPDNKIFSDPEQGIRIKLLINGNEISTTPGWTYPVYNGAANNELSFIIRDAKGNTYYFAPGDKSEISLKGFSDWEYAAYDNYSRWFVTTRWVPGKIVMADGQVITYTHAQGQYQPTFHDARYYYVKEWTGSSYATAYNPSTTLSYNSYTQLTGIHYPNGVRVDFLYDPQKKTAYGEGLLNKIKVSSGGNCLQYVFHQDTINQRWFLNGITQLSCDGSQSEPYYSFGYNDIELPPRLNAAQDFFGYYNGEPLATHISGPGYTGDTLMVPKHAPINYGSNRTYNAHYAQAGLLSKVENAYGGSEYYYYGPNAAAGQLSAMLPNDSYFLGVDAIDGVRLDSIVQKDKYHPGHSKTTAFAYSGGQLFLTGGYFHYPHHIDSITHVWDQVIFQSMFLTAHQLFNGSNHGYSNVTVKTFDVDNSARTFLNRRDYVFTNMKDATSNNQPRYYKVPGSKDFYEYPYTDKQYLRAAEIGLPLSTTDYDQNNRIINKIVNHYDFGQVDLSAASYISNKKIAMANSGNEVGTINFDPGNISSILNVYYPYKIKYEDDYYPYRQDVKLDYTVTQKYISDTRFITDTAWYHYDGHHNLSSTITQDSKGGKVETRLVYNYDVDGPTALTGLATSHPGTTLYNMTDAGLEIPVSTERWQYSPSITDNNLLSAYISRYQFENGQLWTKGLLNTDNGQPLSYAQYTGITQGGTYVDAYHLVLSAYNTTGDVDHYKKTSQVTLFDIKGNPLETQLQDQDLYKAMIWDTATGQKLAEAANCRYSDIACTSFENSLPEGNLSGSKANIIVSSGAITGSHVGLLWTQTTPGTAISFTGTQNLKAGKPYILSFWVYGGVPAIHVGSQVIPVSSADLLYTKGNWKNYQVNFTPTAAGKLKITGTAAFSQVDEVRLFPANAQMQSWTYGPLFGKSSETDASGRVTYYEYDKMGRQHIARDQDGNIISEVQYHVAQ